MTANVSQLSSLPEGGEAAHALSHAYIPATPEMPFIPLDERSGFVKETWLGGGEVRDLGQLFRLVWIPSAFADFSSSQTSWVWEGTELSGVILCNCTRQFGYVLVCD